MKFHSKTNLGFTLLELLIAITVFSILSTIAYSGLKIVLDTDTQTSRHIEQLGQLQKAFSLIQRDIEQALNREVRDEFGEPLPPMRSGGLSGQLLEFTRGGRPNPINLPRSDLQRVGYQLEEETLFRLSWPRLDRPQESKPNRTALIDGIQSLEIGLYDQQMKLQEAWPPAKTGLNNQPTLPLPKGLELRMEVENLGEIRRIFRVAELPALQTGAGQ